MSPVDSNNNLKITENDTNSNNQIKFENFNNNITTFSPPMGSAGNLIGIFPVVLSELETNIYCEIKYKYPIKSLTTTENRVIINQCKFLSKNTKLLIEGLVKKNINVCFFDSYNSKNKIVTIPFKTIVDINYYINPKYDTQYKSKSHTSNSYEYFYSTAEKIYWSHEYTKLNEECYKVPLNNNDSKSEYANKLIVTLGISILQNQKVFIPEPLQTATVVAESNNCKSNNISQEITHIEVGINEKSGLIARIIKG